MISLYFHIPFCTQKCPYCHFYVIPNQAPLRKLLGEGLALEWQQVWPRIQGKPVASIYFGGGTPSLFGPEGIGPLLERIPRDADCEITLEANPEECSYELLKSFSDLGINRISFGVQSLDNRSLTELGRLHSAEKAKQAVLEAERAGFKNISIDLMFDLPDQTEESWRYTLAQVKELPIQHVSLYNLTVEPHTLFFKRGVQPLGGERSLKLLSLGVEKLEELGFVRYEISAFAKPGYASRHNTGYWTGRPFWGYGPSAFSFWEGERFRNHANLQRYVRALREGLSPVDFREKLAPQESAHELLAIGLRRLEGVDWNTVPQTALGSIAQLKKEGLLTVKEGKLRLTERGLLLYDTVATELV